MKVSFLKRWDQIATQLYVSFGGAILLIIIISLLTLFSLNYIGNIQRSISEEHMPEMAAAFAVAQQTAMLSAAIPRLTTADTPEQFEASVVRIDGQVKEFNKQLSAIVRDERENENTLAIKADVDGIIQHIEEIKLLARERFELRRHSLNLRSELQITQSKLTSILTSEIDDQLFYMLTGYQTLDRPKSSRAKHFSKVEIQIYRRLVELREAAATVTQLLATAFTVTDMDLLEPLRERFESTVGDARRALDSLIQHPSHNELTNVFQDLLSVGRRLNNGFDLHGRELAIHEELSAILQHNQTLGVDIVARVKEFVNNSSVATIEMASEATAVTATSATLLLIFNIVSIGGAILLGWFLVQRRLIRRLSRLSSQMKQMAGGKLETEISTDGHDEIAQLAQSLEVFRSNALEVQRLSLVEMLADDLKEKNEELARINEQLKKAQDQIVMQEKLAALGQLTAGVAHEIKNPMNFIMNFSQVSQDLLKELLEEVAKNKPGESLDENYDSELVEEVAEDLTGNLKRIYEHGERANRIVMDMLKMGHGSGEWQPTNINILINQHAMLAFHSARASDSDFQLDIQEDYASEVGEITVQPQDLGRVFLNLVTNACYATDEKRKKQMAETDAGADEYKPTLKLSTRLDGSYVEVRVRDNGNGIPESALEKIFNPFFTTKPPDKGTGLGLSLSMDIVGEHGGKFDVNTKEGEYTEMIVALPLEHAMNHAGDASGDNTSEDTENTEDTASD